MLGIITIAEKPREPRIYTLEEYLRREERAVEKHEFFDGKIIKMAGAKFNHNVISANVISALKVQVRPLPKKYQVCTSDQKIYIEPVNFGVYPDALVICEIPQYWGKREDLLVNP